MTEILTSKMSHKPMRKMTNPFCDATLENSKLTKSFSKVDVHQDKPLKTEKISLKHGYSMLGLIKFRFKFMIELLSGL